MQVVFSNLHVFLMKRADIFKQTMYQETQAKWFLKYIRKSYFPFATLQDVRRGKMGKGDAPYLHYRIHSIFCSLQTWVNNEAECSSRSLREIFIFVGAKYILLLVFLFLINMINNVYDLKIVIYENTAYDCIVFHKKKF